MKRLARGLLALLAMLGISVALPANAYAITCSAGPCGGWVYWDTPAPSGGLYGASAVLNMTCTNAFYPFKNENMLEISENSGSPSRFVDAGIMQGYYSGTMYTTPHFYWAEEKGAGFKFHLSAATYTVGTNLTATISALGTPGNWQINLGSQVFSSTANFSAPARQISTQGLTEDPSSGLNNDNTSLQYRNVSSWASGWNAVSIPVPAQAVALPSSPGYATVYSPSYNHAVHGLGVSPC